MARTAASTSRSPTPPTARAFAPRSPTRASRSLSLLLPLSWLEASLSYVARLLTLSLSTKQLPWLLVRLARPESRRFQSQCVLAPLSPTFLELALTLSLFLSRSRQPRHGRPPPALELVLIVSAASVEKARRRARIPFSPSFSWVRERAGRLPRVQHMSRAFVSPFPLLFLLPLLVR